MRTAEDGPKLIQPREYHPRPVAQPVHPPSLFELWGIKKEEKMSKLIKRGADRLLTPAAMLVLGVVLGLVAAALGWWDWLEPVAGLATLATAAATWWQTRKAREAVYADNGDGSWVVALQVGRPVSEAVKKQFGQLDVLVDVQGIIGTHTLALPEHYEALAKEMYKACCVGQGKNIHIVLSGPVALSFLVGQMVGMFHFQLTVHQFNPSKGSYEPMPRPTRAWLEHRA